MLEADVLLFAQEGRPIWPSETSPSVRRVPCLSHVLTVLGGVAEIGGLVLVIVEIAKVQRREFPEHRGWVKRALEWLRRLGRKPSPRYVDLQGAVEASGALSLRVIRGDPGEDAPTNHRINWLKQQLEDIRQLGQQDKAELHREIAVVREAVAGEVAELRAAVQQREDERREGLSDALLLQKIGVAAFIVGVGLSVWGNLMPC